MEIKENSQMTVVDDEGVEHLLQILFTYDNEERGCSYVFFYDTSDADKEVMCMRYTEENELIEIEDEEEYEECDEVFSAWQEDPEIQKLKEE